MRACNDFYFAFVEDKNYRPLPPDLRLIEAVAPFDKEIRARLDGMNDRIQESLQNSPTQIHDEILPRSDDLSLFLSNKMNRKDATQFLRNIDLRLISEDDLLTITTSNSLKRYETLCGNIYDNYMKSKEVNFIPNNEYLDFMEAVARFSKDVAGKLEAMNLGDQIDKIVKNTDMMFKEVEIAASELRKHDETSE